MMHFISLAKNLKCRSIVILVASSFLFLSSAYAQVSKPNLQFLLQKCSFDDKETMPKIRKLFNEISAKQIPPKDFIHEFDKGVKQLLQNSTESLACTITFQNTLYQYKFSRGYENTKSALLVFATKGGEDAFWTLEEFGNFWKDSIAIVDTVKFNVSKLSGIHSGILKYQINGKEYNLEKNISDPTHFISSNSAGILPGKFLRITLLHTGIKEFRYTASIYFLSSEEKKELHDYIHGLLEENPQLKNSTLLNLCMTYIKLNFAPPNEENVNQFLGNENIKH